MDTQLPHGLRIVIGQIRTSSHHLRIETGRWEGIQTEERICPLCDREPETEEHYICRCTVYYDIRGRYHCLFQEGFGPLRRIMQFEDQRCLGFFLLELQRRRATILWSRRPPQLGSHRQRAVTDFFTDTRQSMADTTTTATQPTGVHHHWTSSSVGVPLDRVVALSRSRRPRPPGRRPRHPHHRQIKAIIERHRRQMPRRLSHAEIHLLRGQTSH